MQESGNEYELLLTDCERLAIHAFGLRMMVLLDQVPGRPMAGYRAYLQQRGERVTHDPSRFGESFGGSPSIALSELRSALRSCAPGTEPGRASQRASGAAI